MADIFERRSTTITISEFYDGYINNKYNFEAAYQRNSGIWSDDKRSFLIDSVIKNYPIPAIFLRPTVDNSTGRTVYDVIDGKQRLETIISFIEGKIEIPSYFSEDKLLVNKMMESEGDISGLNFDQIKNASIFSSYVRKFWTYSLNVEYLYEQDEEIIASVFDRLNRNGEPLTGQELRNAKYASSRLLTIVKEIADRPFWQKKLLRLKSSRMENHEFISELFFVVAEDNIIDLSQKELDDLYEKHKNGDELKVFKNKFLTIENYLNNMNINFERNKRLYGATHIYSVFTLAWQAQKKGYTSEIVGGKANNFFDIYFSRNSNYEGVRDDLDVFIRYKEASSSRTRSEGQRKKRLRSLLTFCDIPDTGI